MNNLSKYSITILAIFAIVLPRVLPAEIKQALSTEQWQMLVHIAVSIASLIYLWKALSIEAIIRKRLHIIMAVILFFIAGLAAADRLGSASFFVITIIYAGWFVLREAINNWLLPE